MYNNFIKKLFFELIHYSNFKVYIISLRTLYLEILVKHFKKLYIIYNLLNVTEKDIKLFQMI